MSEGPPKEESPKLLGFSSEERNLEGFDTLTPEDGGGIDLALREIAWVASLDPPALRRAAESRILHRESGWKEDDAFLMLGELKSKIRKDGIMRIINMGKIEPEAKAL